MKLICIAKPVTIPPQLEPYVPVVLKEYEGGVAEVLEDGAYYTLSCFPDWFHYHHSLFAILPDKSADEMSQESKEAIVNIEHSIL